jgi:hypothetical protein
MGNGDSSVCNCFPSSPVSRFAIGWPSRLSSCLVQGWTRAGLRPRYITNRASSRTQVIICRRYSRVTPCKQVTYSPGIARRQQHAAKPAETSTLQRVLVCTSDPRSQLRVRAIEPHELRRQARKHLLRAGVAHKRAPVARRASRDQPPPPPAAEELRDVAPRAEVVGSDLAVRAAHEAALRG